MDNIKILNNIGKVKDVQRFFSIADRCFVVGVENYSVIYFWCSKASKSANFFSVCFENIQQRFGM